MECDPSTPLLRCIQCSTNLIGVLLCNKRDVNRFYIMPAQRRQESVQVNRQCRRLFSDPSRICPRKLLMVSLRKLRKKFRRDGMAHLHPSTKDDEVTIQRESHSNSKSVHAKVIFLFVTCKNVCQCNDSAFGLGVSELLGEPPSTKRLKLSLSKVLHDRFWKPVTAEERSESAKGVVPTNTKRATNWVLWSFGQWRENRNNSVPEDPVPENLFEKDAAEVLCKWSTSRSVHDSWNVFQPQGRPGTL